MSNKREHFITPKAEVVWAFLDKPSDKFNPDGVYIVTLAFDGKDKAFREITQTLKERRDEEFEKWGRDNPKLKKSAKPAPVAVKELGEDEEPTGRMLLSFKMTAKGVSRRTGKEFTMSPDVFDAKGVKLETTPAIGGGSVVKVAYETLGTYVASSKLFYLSLRLQAVQLLELVESGSRSAEYYGFEEEEGYTAEGGEPKRTSQFDEDEEADDGYDTDDESDGDGDY